VENGEQLVRIGLQQTPPKKPGFWQPRPN